MNHPPITRSNAEHIRLLAQLVLSSTEWPVSQSDENRMVGATVKFSRDGQLVASIGWDTSLHVYETASFQSVFSRYGTLERVWREGAAFSIHPSKRLIGARLDHNFSLIDLENGMIRDFGRGFIGEGWSEPISHKGRFLAYEVGKKVHLWDLEADTEVSVLEGHTSSILGFLFSPDDQLLASSGGYISSGRIDSTIRLWETDTGKLRHVLDSGELVMTMAFSPDGSLLAASYFVGSMGEITLWDVETGAVRSVLRGHQRPATYIEFSKNGKQLASGSWDNTVRLWNVQTGQEILTCKNPEALIVGLCFNLDDSLLMTAWREQKIVLWDTETGEQRAAWQVPDVESLAISPDGTLLATGSWNGIQLWSVVQ